MSSVSNFRPDTRGRRWSLVEAHLFNNAVGREEHCKQISLACVGSACSVSATLGLFPLMACVLSQSTLFRLQVALQGVGPGLCALPRSKLLRFRFSGTPQRHRLGWACICAQIRAAQVTRCWSVILNHLPSPSCSVSWVHHESAISGMLCVSFGELISGCDPPGRCQLSRIPGRLG